MTPDRDEALLRRALQEGLHPAETDLWPAVAEALPAREERYRRRTRALRLVICIGAPLLLAAGVLLGRAEFTNLRTNPRPSFAPDKNTGYAIQYDQTAYQLPDRLMDSLMAHARDEADDDGLAPMHSSFSGRNLPSTNGPGGRGYASWTELTAAAGLPLLQSDLLDAGKPMDAIWLFPTWPTPLPDGWESWSSEALNAYINRINLPQPGSRWHGRTIPRSIFIPAGWTRSTTGTPSKPRPMCCWPRRTAPPEHPFPATRSISTRKPGLSGTWRNTPLLRASRRCCPAAPATERVLPG